MRSASESRTCLATSCAITARAATAATAVSAQSPNAWASAALRTVGADEHSLLEAQRVAGGQCVELYAELLQIDARGKSDRHQGDLDSDAWIVEQRGREDRRRGGVIEAGRTIDDPDQDGGLARPRRRLGRVVSIRVSLLLVEGRELERVANGCVVVFDEPTRRDELAGHGRVGVAARHQLRGRCPIRAGKGRDVDVVLAWSRSSPRTRTSPNRRTPRPEGRRSRPCAAFPPVDRSARRTRRPALRCSDLRRSMFDGRRRRTRARRRRPRR